MLFWSFFPASIATTIAVPLSSGFRRSAAGFILRPGSVSRDLSHRALAGGMFTALALGWILVPLGSAARLRAARLLTAHALLSAGPRLARSLTALL